MPVPRYVYRRWYKTKRWQQKRARQLRRDPKCQCPHCKGEQLDADTVDHRIAHKGDSRLFWDENNLQSMAKVCHDRFKQSQERGGVGFLKGSDEHGDPLDPAHPWYRE